MSDRPAPSISGWEAAFGVETSEQALAVLNRLIGQVDQWRWDLFDLSKQVTDVPQAGLAEHARTVANQCDALYWHLTIAAAVVRDAP